MKGIIFLSRIILGAVFTLSGISKAIDPVGSEIKFMDYFNAFGISSLSSIALTLAIILSALEFLVGISLLFNIKPKLSSIGALLFMIIFTPLTLYIAIADPVADCGCFGDIFIISNWQTFWKNLILITLAIFLYYSVKKDKSSYNIKTEYIFIAVSILLIVGFQIYNIRHLPVIDSRPYAEGTHIHDKMIIPEGAKQDSSLTYLFYEKNGKTEKFLIDDIPWQDTTWKWVKTESKIIEKGYEPPIHDFSMYLFSNEISIGKKEINEDILQKVLADKSFSFLSISPDLVKTRIKDFEKIIKLKSEAKKLNYKIYFLTSSTAQDINLFNRTVPLGIDFYITDVLTLKTMVRSNPGLILINNGTIIKKWHHNDFPDMEEVKGIIE